MKQVKVEMLDLYENYEDIIEYFTFNFPKVLAKKMFDIGEDCYIFSLEDLKNTIKVDTGCNFDIDDFFLITKALGYNVKRNLGKNVTLTFYL